MDFKSYLKQQELSKTTAEMYYYQTMNFISFLDKDATQVEHCTEKEIMLYMAHLQKKDIAPQTRKLRLWALKHFFNYQIETGQRKDNPVNRIKLQGGQKQKLYPILSLQELQSIYENYNLPKEDDPRSHHNWFTAYKLSKERNKVIIGLLFNQGITTAEVSRITTDDLDLRNGKIDIRGARTGKDRTLELKSSQIMDLMEYQYKTRNELLKYHIQPTKLLFLSTPPSGQTQVKDPSTLNIYKRLTEELKEHHPKFINFLQVRASVITYWLKNYNLRQVQYFAGHKRIISTEMYLINDIDDLQREIDTFHPIG
jgi:site-specific recombinase XerD